MVEINIEQVFLFTRQRNKIVIVVYIEVPLKEEKNRCRITLWAEVKSTVKDHFALILRYGLWS